MAKPSRQQPFRGFDYITPTQNQTVTVGSDGKIAVTVNDMDQGQASYTATLTPFVLGSGTGVPIDTQPLAQLGTSNQFSARLNAGVFTDPPPGVNNRFV